MPTTTDLLAQLHATSAADEIANLAAWLLRGGRA